MHDIFPATTARVAQWSQQPEILGVLLVGSKSRGHDDELSELVHPSRTAERAIHGVY